MNTTLNPFGIPYIGDMYKNAGKLFKSSFYGYINGDILVENTINGVLRQIQKDIQSGKLCDKVSVFTHRKNMFANFPDDSYKNHQESREFAFFISFHNS